MPGSPGSNLTILHVLIFWLAFDIARSCQASLQGCMAAKTKYLAANNKRRTSTKPTNNQSAPRSPPVVQIGAASVLAGGFSSPFARADAVPLYVDRCEQVFIEIRSSDVRDSTCDSTAGSGYTGRGRLLLPHVPQSVSGHLDQDIRAPA